MKIFLSALLVFFASISFSQSLKVGPIATQGEYYELPISIQDMPTKVGALTIWVICEPAVISCYGEIDSERWPGVLTANSSMGHSTSWFYRPSWESTQSYFPGEGLLLLDIKPQYNTTISVLVELADRDGKVLLKEEKLTNINIGKPYTSPIKVWQCGDLLEIDGIPHLTKWVEASKSCLLDEDLKSPDFDLIFNGQHTWTYTSENAEKACPVGWKLADRHHLESLSLASKPIGYYQRDAKLGWVPKRDDLLYWRFATYLHGRYYYKVSNPKANVYDRSTRPIAAYVRCFKQ